MTESVPLDAYGRSERNGGSDLHHYRRSSLDCFAAARAFKITPLTTSTADLTRNSPPETNLDVDSSFHDVDARRDSHVSA